jgi:putative isomerase
MVPDTIRAKHEDENWRNTKPARAAWALDALATAAPEAVAEFLPRCLQQIEWWHALRRQDHDTRYRPGGADLESAIWDTGWDESKRFEDVGLSRRTPWKLLDIWPVDVNALLLVELRALRSLAERSGDEHLRTDLRRRTRTLEAALGEHWSSELGLFVDRVPDPAPANWRPLRTLASAYPVWAGLGGAAARAGLAKELLNPERFATPMPLPTVAADEQGFDPLGGWNGSVFPEHAATALLALGEAGESLHTRFLEGLDRLPALYECYDPLTGEPVRGERPAYAQSSATAAAILELVCR